MAFAPTDLIDYVFRFPDQGSALRDLVVGPSFFGVKGGSSLSLESQSGFFLLEDSQTSLQIGALPAKDLSFPNKEVLVFQDARRDSVDALSGYWFIVTAIGLLPEYENHPNIQIVNDLTLMNLGQNSLVSSKFDTSFTNIVVSNFCVYCRGLFASPVLSGYVTEDLQNFYVTEDQLNIYIPTP